VDWSRLTRPTETLVWSSRPDRHANLSGPTVFSGSGLIDWSTWSGLLASLLGRSSRGGSPGEPGSEPGSQARPLAEDLPKAPESSTTAPAPERAELPQAASKEM
jgi:hypothetical protein